MRKRWLLLIILAAGAAQADMAFDLSVIRIYASSLTQNADPCIAEINASGKLDSRPCKAFLLAQSLVLESWGRIQPVMESRTGYHPEMDTAAAFALIGGTEEDAEAFGAGADAIGTVADRIEGL